MSTARLTLPPSTPRVAVGDFPAATAAAPDEGRLARRWHRHGDEEALGQLIAAHLGLVVHIALEFRHAGPSLEDLIQEGNLGLTIAARRFDPDRATRLSTYATWWIRACILDHVVRSHGPVRIGTTRSQRRIFFGVGRARRALEQEGSDADAEALAGALGVPVTEVEEMAPRISARDLSLDATRRPDDPRSLSEALAGGGATPEELLSSRQEEARRRSLLLGGLRALEPRERAIIRARYLEARPATLSAIGRKLGISRERVRQLERRAEDRLRAECRRGADEARSG